ncbi:helix-hairpin-helix domain-containing protein [Halocola ammonii]
MRLPDSLKDFFHFNSRERNGLIILMATLTGVAIFYFLMPRFYAVDGESVSEEELKEVKLFLASAEKKAALKFDSNSKPEEVVFEPFEFDPNGLDKEDWMKLGLTEREAEIVKKYESKGGKFEVKKDVLKLYPVDSALYEKLESFILLPDEKERKPQWESESEKVVFEPFEFDPNGLPVEKWMKLGLTRKQAETIKRYEASGGSFETKRDVLNLWQVDEDLYEKLKPYILLPETFEQNFERYKEKAEIVKVEINSADTASLKKVRGIGSFFAEQIVEYREELGGYHSLDQLMEVYLAEEEKVVKWKSQLELDSSSLRKLNVNTATAEELWKHPYLEWKHANAIVSYREQHGLYKSTSDILKIVIIDQSRFDKIKPYLTIE